MGLFGKKKRSKEGDVFFNEIGEEIHEFEDGTRIKKYNALDFLFMGDQYCPDCHLQMDEEDERWRCSICGYTFEKDDLEYSNGYPSLESTYEDDFGGLFSTESEKPDICDECGGDWPNCMNGCKFFDD